jgi:hypothetical protein
MTAENYDEKNENANAFNYTQAKSTFFVQRANASFLH